MEINREELAWAAGFHDGEGCFFLDRRKISITFAISNTHLPAVERFMTAVGIPRTITAPPEKRARRQIYRYAVRSFEGCQAIAAMLAVPLPGEA